MAVTTDDRLGPTSSELKKPYCKELYETVKYEYETKKVLLEPDDVFNAFAFTPLADAKTAILGRDPYHNYGQAHGLCFSVKPDMDIPPSLVNIHQELYDDLGCCILNNGYLKKWANQNVMLLNTVLTVGTHQTNSHRDVGQERFTDAVTDIFNQQNKLMVFTLWGRPTQAKKVMLNNPRHLILEAPHPSPLSTFRGFSGSRPLSGTNTFLAGRGLASVNWRTENVQNRYKDR